MSKQDKPITVNGTRILTPDIVNNMLDGVYKTFQRRRFFILLYSGLRYVELERLHSHPEWYDMKRNNIHLDRFAARKIKRTQLERDVFPLPPLMPELMREFFNDPKPPIKQVWDKYMIAWGKKAGLEPFMYADAKGNARITYGLGAKTTRKTIESWLIAGGMQEGKVFLRQGHDKLTSLRHYQGLPFTEEELNAIKGQLKGWAIE